MLSQRLADDQRHLTHLGEGHARHGVQVDPQFVRVLEVVSAHRVRIEVDAAEVDDPGQLGRVAHDDLRGGPTGREAQLHRLDPRRPRLGRPLLEEEVAAGAVHEALEGHRPAGHAAQRPVGHGEVVAHEVELGRPDLGEEDLVRVRDHDLAADDLEHLAPYGHGGNDTTGRRAQPHGTRPRPPTSAGHDREDRPVRTAWAPDRLLSGRPAALLHG